MRQAAVVVGAGLLVLAAPAFAQPDVGTFFVRGSVGFASQSLSDWNDDIDAIESALRSGGVPASFENFGGAIPFGFEVGVQVHPSLAVSLGVFRQSDRVDNTYSDVTGSLASNAKIAITSVTGAISYWVPTAPGLFFGGDLGMGFGTAKNELIFRDFGDPANNFDIHGDWSGNGLVAGVFAGYQRQLAGGFLVHGRLGYQQQNLGTFDGDLTSPQFGSYSGPLLSNAGENMDTDFSGVQLMLGIGMAFGTRR